MGYAEFVRSARENYRDEHKMSTDLLSFAASMQELAQLDFFASNLIESGPGTGELRQRHFLLSTKLNQ